MGTPIIIARVVEYYGTESRLLSERNHLEIKREARFSRRGSIFMHVGDFAHLADRSINRGALSLS